MPSRKQLDKKGRYLIHKEFQKHDHPLHDQGHCLLFCVNMAKSRCTSYWAAIEIHFFPLLPDDWSLFTNIDNNLKTDDSLRRFRILKIQKQNGNIGVNKILTV